MENTLSRNEKTLILEKNIKLFYSIRFLGSLTFTSAIWTFFLTSYHNFGYTDAFIIYLISLVVSTVLEVHSGSWADRYGRKKLFILGTFSLFLGSSIWIFASSFFMFIIAGIFTGIGYAIASGNFSAILHDSLEDLDQEKKFKDIMANGHVSLFIGRFVAAIGAGFLYSFSPLAPAIFTTFFLFITVIATFFIHSPKQELSSRDINHNAHIGKSIHFLYTQSYLKYIIIITVLSGGLGNIYWFTYQVFFSEMGITIEQTGILFGIIALLSALGSHLIKKIQDYFTSLNIIFFSSLAMLLSAVTYASFNLIISLTGLIILSIYFGTLSPFTNTQLLKNCPKDKKSTVLSIHNFLFTLVMFILVIVSGLLLDIIGIQKLYYINFFLILLLTIYSFWGLQEYKKYKI